MHASGFRDEESHDINKAGKRITAYIELQTSYDLPVLPIFIHLYPSPRTFPILSLSTLLLALTSPIHPQTPNRNLTHNSPTSPIHPLAPPRTPSAHPPPTITPSHPPHQPHNSQRKTQRLIPPLPLHRNHPTVKRFHDAVICFQTHETSKS